MVRDDLTSGTFGNLSAQGSNERIAVSPSGVAYEDVTPSVVPVIGPSGEQLFGEYGPSSELPMHTVVYDHRDEVGGIVHTHSPYATTFASLDRPVEAAHYLIAFGGVEIPVAEYATYGTETLGRHAAKALGEDHDAVLLKNHGVLTVGEDLESAYETALNVEFSARIQYQAEAIGDPVILDDAEVEHLREKFTDYGQSGN